MVRVAAIIHAALMLAACHQDGGGVPPSDTDTTTAGQPALPMDAVTTTRSVDGDVSGHQSPMAPLTSSPGGSTGDFSASASAKECVATIEEKVGDSPKLAISVEGALSYAAGDLEVPMYWVSACGRDNVPGPQPEACEDSADLLNTIGGMPTTLRISVIHDGEPATVHYPTDVQPACAARMLLPVRIALESDDMNVRGDLPGVLETFCPSAIHVGGSVALSALNGSLPEAGAAWGSDIQMRVQIEYQADRVTVEFFVEPNGRYWLLAGGSTPERSTISLSRAEAGLPGATLPLPGQVSCSGT